MIGQTVLHYKILEKLGEGGMGIVYKVHDTKLDREVAIKILPKHIASNADERQRFKIEARAAAALNHPNIATIHAIEEHEGELFLVMEYIEGRELREIIQSEIPNPKSAIDYATQIASGLQAAHEKGITHRDIKSSNIMVTESGQVKIMDFGLAKIRGSAQLTKVGTTMGTAAYMSPEQARGENVDHRTDIWAFGVVLYEMLAGELPFKGDYEQAVIYAILNEEPTDLRDLREDVPGELIKILERTLEKEADARYQNIQELLADLKGVPTKPPAEGAKHEEKHIPSIAVLPFVNMSADPENEYFSDGLAEDIINALTKINDFRVVARTSAFSFKGKDADIREIGQKLNVATVLEGSVRKAGNRLRITAQLINVEDGYHLWSEQYDRVMQDVFAIQDEITLAIVDKLKVRLLGSEKAGLESRATENFEAYNLYLRGRHFWNKRTVEDLKKGLRFFEEAVALDPDYALAYAGIADSHIILGSAFQDFEPPNQMIPKAKEAALKALELDGTLAEAHASLGMIHMHQWNWSGAQQSFNQAISSNPNYPMAHYWYSFLLLAGGRRSEAEKELQQALELDPLSLIFNLASTMLIEDAKHLQLQAEKVLDLEPNFWLTHSFLGVRYAQMGKHKDAVAFAERGLQISKNSKAGSATLGYVYAMAGERSKAEKLIQDLQKRAGREYVAPFLFAWIHVGLGNTDEAFSWLEKAVEQQDAYMVLAFSWEPSLGPLRKDSRHTEIVKKMGLRP